MQFIQVVTDLIRYMTDEELKDLGIYRENGVIKGPLGVKSVEQGQQLQYGVQ
jgi:hypothetical protein